MHHSCLEKNGSNKELPVYSPKCLQALKTEVTYSMNSKYEILAKRRMIHGHDSAA